MRTWRKALHTFDDDETVWTTGFYSNVSQYDNSKWASLRREATGTELIALLQERTPLRDGRSHEVHHIALEFTVATGGSWNQNHGHQHGNILQFCRNHPGCFEVSLSHHFFLNTANGRPNSWRRSWVKSISPVQQLLAAHRLTGERLANSQCTGKRFAGWQLSVSSVAVASKRCNGKQFSGKQFGGKQFSGKQFGGKQFSGKQFKGKQFSGQAV
jgi:hypothetical protein